MSQHISARTVAAIRKVIEEVQFLTEHPRMKQRNWVAKGKEWLPVLRQAQEDLEQEVQQFDQMVDAHNALLGAIAAIGLTVEKRDATAWAYRWHGGPLEGAYPTQAEAVEAGLRVRYGVR